MGTRSQYSLRCAMTSGSEMLTKIVTLPDGATTTVVLPDCTFGVTLHAVLFVALIDQRPSAAGQFLLKRVASFFRSPSPTD